MSRVIRKVFRKIIFSLLIVVGMLVVSSIIVTYLYKDRLINHFIREANKSLNTPVDVGRMDVSALAHFPRISLLMYDVKIKDSFPGHENDLLSAERMDFTFNPFSALFGDITIDEVSLTNAVCQLKTSRSGDINYLIFKAPSDSVKSERVRLDLSRIHLEDVRFQYDNARTEVLVAVRSSELSASLSAFGPAYDIAANGQVHIDSIISGKWEMARAIDLSLQTRLAYNDSIKLVDIQEAQLTTLDKPFSLEGYYAFLDIPEIDIHAASDDFNVESVIALLPKASTGTLREYVSEGNVHFDLDLKGKWQDGKGPALAINFGMKNSTIRHGGTGMTLDDVSLSGLLAMKDVLNSHTSSLELPSVRGKLNRAPFSGALSWQDFLDPFLQLSFNGDLDVESMLKFYPVKGIESGRGTILANIKFEGKPEQLKYKKFINRVKTSGELALNAIYLDFTEIGPGLRNLNGGLRFSNNDLALSDVTGKFGRSDFLLNGYFKNVIAYLLFEDEPVGVDARLKSNLIDLDELLSLQDTENNDSYSFGISKRLRVLFDCEIDRLNFRRFHPTNIRGDLKIREQIAFTDRLSFTNMGGKMQLSGMADASKSKLVRISTNFKLDHIAVDSIFYVFENFDQNFLEDRHLKGNIDATVDAEMILSDQLKLYPETLRSHITATIRNGELNNFEPMQKLAPYLDERELRHLRFSELANDIVIRDKTIYLPKMEVGSNVTDIVISGTHTFDQKINYSVQAPLQSKKRRDSDEAFGAIEEDASGRAMLFLKIVGTTSDYYVNYDKENVKKKIAQDLKKEADELKTIFKNKGKEQETLELKEDEYFDWDDDNKGNEN